MPNGSHGRGLRSRLPLVATALTLVTTLSSCGLLGGDEEEPASSEGGNGNLEKTTLNVSIMTTTDLAPFHLAIKEGFFEDEGLEIKFEQAPSGGESVGKLPSGQADIAYSSYTPFFVAESQGAANNKGGIKLIADASSAGPDSCVVVAMPNSKVKSIRDMDGKRVRVAVTAEGTISDLLTMATLKANGINYDIQWVKTPFPQTSQALMRGDVDAAFATEPFISDTHKNGAVTIFDTAEGPTANFPTAGWGSTGDFVKENPNTIAAFQRAMQRGTDLALSDRSLVEPLLVEHSKVDEQTAKVATLLTFQSKLDASRIQRVPDLMLEFGVIKTPLDVADMIVPTAPLT
jgi:NitT/TauT family transport system substrate-binding protein